MVLLSATPVIEGRPSNEWRLMYRAHSRDMAEHVAMTYRMDGRAQQTRVSKESGRFAVYGWGGIQ